MFLLIFEYIDRIFSVIRPRKLLYMAIDGPAPRAKMNQQRSRRFKAAKERAEKAAVEAELDAELRANGHEPPPAEGSGFDSNVITPGTAFMGRLAKWLQYYAQSRIHSEPAWARIKARPPTVGHRTAARAAAALLQARDSLCVMVVSGQWMTEARLLTVPQVVPIRPIRHMRVKSGCDESVIHHLL